MKNTKAARLFGAAAVAAVVALVAAGCGAKAPGAGDTSALELQNTTPKASRDFGSITWATYRPASTLDPVKSADQPENAPLNALCEGLLMQEPDGAIAPWLAESVEYTTPTEVTIRLRPGITFWDGTPMTAADVVFSLQRAQDPHASFYAGVFAHVSGITAVDERTVRIDLTTPDYWLRQQLATTAGVIIQKAFAETAGEAYGTPGNVMCSGPFTLKSWQAGGELVVEKNARYWDKTHSAHVSEIAFIAAGSDADLLAGLTSGSIDGTFNPVLSTYKQIKGSARLTVTTGWSGNMDALAVLDFKGLMGDERIRQALSLGLDRKAYIGVAYPGGQAMVPRTTTNSATWSLDRKAFEQGLGDMKPLSQDLAVAKKLIGDASATGKSITMATTSLPSVTAAANAVVQAGKAIGLKVELKNFSIADYTSIFYDPSARAGIDLVDTLLGATAADPGTALETYALPGAVNNYGGWSDQKVTDLLAQAQTTEDPAERAGLEAKADRIVTEALAVIPLAEQTNSVVMSKDITGAPASSVAYLYGPWARLVGGAKR